MCAFDNPKQSLVLLSDSTVWRGCGGGGHVCVFHIRIAIHLFVLVFAWGGICFDVSFLEKSSSLE